MHNSVTGDVYGPLVQAGYVTGDINLHTHTTRRPPAELPLRIGVVPQRAASFQRRELSWNSITVLSGMGGVGKTQLAADHAATEWAAGNVSLLVWVTTGSRNAIVSTYAEAAAELTGRDDPDQERGARKFLEWLAAADEPWLVVLDDLQDPDDLADLWPPDNGRTLVTTRRRDAVLRGHERQVLDVETFSESEALSYLRSVLADQPALLDGAAELVGELGCLPLALAQAGAYVLDRHVSCAEYLIRLAKVRFKSVAATWSLSIRQADSLHPRRVAGHLLDIVSVLDPNGIPLDALLGPSTRNYVVGRTGAKLDADGLRDVFTNLHRLSLITLDTGSPSREVRVHALVQRANRDGWSTRKERRVVWAAADALSDVWERTRRNDETAQALRANEEVLTAVGGEHLWGTASEYHQLPISAGASLGASGRKAEARDHFTRLYDAAARHRGPHDLFALLARSSTAYWRARSGDVDGALAEYEQILAEEPRVPWRDRAVLRDLRWSDRQEQANLRAAAGDLAGAISRSSSSSPTGSGNAGRTTARRCPPDGISRDCTRRPRPAILPRSSSSSCPTCSGCWAPITPKRWQLGTTWPDGEPTPATWPVPSPNTNNSSRTSCGCSALVTRGRWPSASASSTAIHWRETKRARRRQPQKSSPTTTGCSVPTTRRRGNGGASSASTASGPCGSRRPTPRRASA